MNKVYSAVKIFYQSLLKNHLLVVQSTQTGVLISAGDFIAQTAVERKKLSEVNVSRMSKFFILGAGLVGPALTVWYRFLSKAVKKGTNKTVVLKKIAMDQLFFAPISTLVFISTVNIMEGKNWTFIKNELKYKYTNILVTSYSIWPFVQFVNFYAVPLKHQVLVVQTVALFWNTYLCWKTQQKIIPT